MTTTMQEAKKRLFGTDGIRGIPGKHPLDDATLVRVGRALGTFLRAAHPRIRAL
jgi:phosphoglucosamine mutase